MKKKSQMVMTILKKSTPVKEVVEIANHELIMN